MPPNHLSRPGVYRVYGMSQSYFTRKMTGYLDYKGIPYLLRRFAFANSGAKAVGWPGAMPLVMTPERTFMWDTTAMIEYLETRFPHPAVLPEDPVLRFLAYALEDVVDEWFYRPAVGSRWLYGEENQRVGGWELARDGTHEIAIPADQAFQAVKSYVTATCEPFGVTADNVSAWIEEILRPWMRAAGAHLAQHSYFFGERPSLADFAFFGGNAAHFVNDPQCRRWVDEDAPAVVKHTHRLMEPEDQDFGEWNRDVPDTLLAMLADLGRFYLPWVSRAAVEGSAEIVFASGPRVEIKASPFLREARRVLLARYRQYRCGPLDSVLERAGILSYYAGFVAHAGAVPVYDQPPQPVLNRPFAPPWEAEA